MCYSVKDWNREKKLLIVKHILIPFILSYLVIVAFVLSCEYIDNRVVLGIVIPFLIDYLIQYMNLNIIEINEPVYENDKLFSYMGYYAMINKFIYKISIIPMVLFIVISTSIMCFIDTGINFGILLSIILRGGISGIYEVSTM